MKRVSLILLVVICSSLSLAQSIDIGLWRDGKSTNRFYFMCDTKTDWKAGSETITLPANKSLYFTLKNGKVRLSTAEHVYGIFREVTYKEHAPFSLVSLKPTRRQEIYCGGLEVTSNSASLLIINTFSDIENYISGVVEAETGKEQNKEFYKVQATISRTFAISNSRRHEGEGFNLCDQVHCQVYHGISRHNPDILLATEETAGEVFRV